jgi:hypothetical protein
MGGIYGHERGNSRQSSQRTDYQEPSTKVAFRTSYRILLHPVIAF